MTTKVQPALPAPDQCSLPQDGTAVPEPSQLHINLLSKQLGQNHSQILIYKERAENHFNFVRLRLSCSDSTVAGEAVSPLIHYAS